MTPPRVPGPAPGAVTASRGYTAEAGPDSDPAFRALSGCWPGCAGPQGASCSVLPAGGQDGPWDVEESGMPALAPLMDQGSQER